ASGTVKIDKTKPVITADVPPANGAGWFNTDVTVMYVCSDALSGVATCSGNQTLTSEGAAVPYSGNATDGAGNSNSASGTVKIDKTKPTIAPSFIGTAGAGGWFTSDVTVHFACADTLSGVASCPADQVLSTEGASVPYSGTATDVAGNSLTV